MQTRIPFISAVGSLALIGSLVVAAPVSAEQVSDFDAPLLNTTASLQLTRFPSVADLTCSDADCKDGIFREVDPEAPIYSTSKIVRASGFTVPNEYRRGVVQSYYDSTAADNDVAYFTTTIAEYAPGSDMVSVMKQIGNATSMVLTQSQVNGVEVWTGEVVNASDTENIYSGSGFKSAYVLGENHFVRTGCQLGGTALETSTCKLGNLAEIAVQVAQKAPLSKVPNQASLNKLLPGALPKNIRPLIISGAPAQDAWNWMDSPKLEKALGKGITAQTQYTLSGLPKLGFEVITTNLSKSDSAKKALTAKCEEIANRDCSRVPLTESLGYKQVLNDKGNKKAVTSISYVSAGNGQLVLVNCFKYSTVHGAFTAKETASCNAAADAVLNQTTFN